MNHKRLVELMEQVRDGRVPVEVAVEQLRDLPYEDLGFARLDHHRALRQGLPEVVFCQGKTPAQVGEIVARLAAAHDRVLATRATPDHYTAVRERVADAAYHERARAIVVDRVREREQRPGVLVVTAGTSDIPVAEEAALTAELMGNAVERLYDVGVAGIHRLLDNGRKVQQARVIVVVAGMEGALASVVGGLARGPVIAVPTSVGYGASFGGLAALLAMLNSCAPGVAVVNIDNGFGAGYLAGVINRMSWGEIE
jgi:NCAIR mutase (PurE)-related protein